MKKNLLPLIIALVCGGIILSAGSAVGGGSGTVGLGYVLLDEEGNRAVNQETFNTYEGLALSLQDWSYGFDNGTVLRADLRNATLNNRNLRASLSRSGLFSLMLRNNQYRRVYSAAGDRYTRRQNTAAQVKIMPHKFVTLFGGYEWLDRHGSNYFQLNQGRAITSLTDYLQTRMNVGAELHCPNGFLRTEFRSHDLEDQLDNSGNRSAGTFSLRGGSLIPGYHRVFVTGGYTHRRDEIDSNQVELTTNQLWGATRVDLPYHMTADYRLLFARTEHSGSTIETDNWQNSIAIGKKFGGRGGLRIGYENRIVDDLIDRTEANVLSLAGWYTRPGVLLARFRVASQNKEVQTGATLIGEEEYTRHKFNVKYFLSDKGSLAFAWHGKIRENEDIGSKVDFNSLSTNLALKCDRLGRIAATYTYYLGQFENTGDGIAYEFADHAVSGWFYGRAWRKIEPGIGASYYRSRRDADIEKFSVSLTVLYTLQSGYQLSARYDVYNFDDYLTNGAYYTSNVLELKLLKDIEL